MRPQELCESRGCRPGLQVPNKLSHLSHVSADVRGSRLITYTKPKQGTCFCDKQLGILARTARCVYEEPK